MKNDLYNIWYEQYKKKLVEQNVQPWKVSITDRIEFKRCPRRWKYSSLTNMGLESNTPSAKYLLGTIIHKCLEFYYKEKATFECIDGLYHSLWKDALKVFMESPFGKGARTDAVNQIPLGESMLEEYIKFASHDRWRVIATEFEFEYPLIMLGGSPILFRSWAYDYGFNPTLVGKIDLIVYDEAVRQYMIVDHKTSSCKIDSASLEWDDQLSIYLWCMNRMRKINFLGCYNQLRKKIPIVPKILKNGNLSKDKSIDTTHNIYLNAIKENKLNEEDYEDILKILSTKENTFQQRHFMSLKLNQKPIIELQLKRELAIMFAVWKQGFFYSSPDTMNCGWSCDFKALCRSENMSASLNTNLVEEYYHRRDQ